MNYKCNGSDENRGLDRTRNQHFLKIKHGGLIWVRSPLRIILKSIIRNGVPVNLSFSATAGRSMLTPGSHRWSSFFLMAIAALLMTVAAMVDPINHRMATIWIHMPLILRNYSKHST